MLVKKYFTYVSMVQSIIMNIIWGLIFSPFFLVFAAFISPSWDSNRPSATGVFIGSIIILTIILGFIGGNYTIYIICKRIRGIPLEFVNEKLWILKGIIVVMVFLCAASSLLR